MTEAGAAAGAERRASAARPPAGDPPGLRFVDDSDLLRRAVAAVEEGPATAGTLTRDVLGVRNAPPGIARRLVEELLGPDDRVTFADGRWRLRERGVGDRTPLDDLSCVVVDLETTGLSPGRAHRVTEIAAVEVRRGEIAGEFSTLVNPGRPIPARVARLTGITDETVADAPRFAEVAGIVRRKLEGRVFVAHNVPFDWRFLSEEMRRTGGPLPRGPRLCTLRLARRLLPELGSKALDGVADHYGIEIEERHRAAGDARATASLLPRLLAEARGRGIERWHGLRSWLSGEGPRPDAEETDEEGEEARC